jgi:1-deoxy-D-xylulose-5-phosphate reductoisomerase
MKKKIAILGSTGSIGKTLFNILKKNKKEFEIILLTADKNYKELIKQTKIFNVKNIVITNKDSFDEFKKKNRNKEINIYNNFNSISKIFKKKIDYTMSAISGLEGLSPTLKIIRHTRVIAIANKESIICGWNLIKEKLKKNKTSFIPVDSEHFSICYGLMNNKDLVEAIYITASGGPFLKLPLSKFKKIKPYEALNHPTWRMGKKISIDSATMMNKVFEIIEAKKIFNLPYSKLKILIHPNSYVHAMIKFNNGMIKIIVHETSMEIPIFNTLYQKNEKKFNTKKIDMKKLSFLDFAKIDFKRFPVVKIINFLPNKNSLFETVLVSANDSLVNLFLKKKIEYNDISKNLFKIVTSKEFARYKYIIPNKIKDINNLDKYVRFKINSQEI